MKKHTKESDVPKERHLQIETKEFYKVADAIAFLKENTKKRNFVQSFDLIFNLKNIDLRKPENKFSKDINLPHGRGKDIKIGVISDKIKDAITKSDIDNFSKKETKKLVRQYDFFLCEVPLMPFVGKKLGRFLAPIGKMPSPIPPNIPNIEPVIESKKKATRIRLRDTPTIQVIAGSENMDSSHIEENINFVIGEVEKNLAKGKNQIRNVYLKMTMGKAVKLDVR